MRRALRQPNISFEPFSESEHTIDVKGEPVMYRNLRLAKLTAFVAFSALSQTSFASTGAAQTARVEVHPIKTVTLTDQ